MYLFNIGELRIKSTSRKKERARLKIRFHTAIIILLLEEAIKKDNKIKELDIQICNDIDGHFHEIKNMIYNHLSKKLPSLKKDDIVQTKFPKTILVDISAKNLRENNKQKIGEYIIPKIDVNRLIKIIKK